MIARIEKTDEYKETTLCSNAVDNVCFFLLMAASADRNTPADFRSREGDSALGRFDNQTPRELCTTITEGAWGFFLGVIMRKRAQQNGTNRFFAPSVTAVIFAVSAILVGADDGRS